MESNNGIYSLFLPETVPASARLCLNLKAKTDFFVVSTDWSLIRFIVLVLSGSLVKAKFHYASWFEAGRRQVRTCLRPASNQIRTR